jgi:hypothetical protein
MTREEFIEELDGNDYSYVIEGDKIVIPERFNNNVWLESITSLPFDVEFRNAGNINLGSLKSLPPGTKFNNGGYVWLQSLKSFPANVTFSKENPEQDQDVKDVQLGSITGGWFSLWEGNIEGIHSGILLNKMISLGLFDKERV